MQFRALAAGDPAIRIDRVLARDAANRPLPADRIDLGVTPATALLAPAPNPAARSTVLGFTLSAPGAADLAIFAIDGRRVKTLARGTFAAGTRHFTWNGDDDQHHAAAAGIYFARLVTNARALSCRLVYFP